METIDLIKCAAFWTELHCVLCQLPNYHALWHTLWGFVLWTMHFLFHLISEIENSNSIFTIPYICLYLKMNKTYFFPFWCEGRCSLWIPFGALLFWRGFTPVTSCIFVIWWMGDKIRIGFWNIFAQMHFKQSLW